MSNINLTGSGFSLVPITAKEGCLMAATDGHEKTGKSTFAMSAPAPLCVIGTDTGSQDAAEKQRRKGRKIYLSYHSCTDSTGTQQYHQKKWDGLKRDLDWVRKNKAIRSLVIDDGSNFYDMKRMALFGKLEQVPQFKYGVLNNELNELLMELWERRPRMNIVIPHKVKKEYQAINVVEKGVKVTKDSWCGAYKRDGYAGLAYIADVNLQHYAESVDVGGQLVTTLKAKITGIPREGGPEYAGMVLEGDMLTFPALGMMLIPDADPGYWEDRD